MALSTERTEGKQRKLAFEAAQGWDDPAGWAHNKRVKRTSVLHVEKYSRKGKLAKASGVSFFS